jgi:solute carrier family 8 (sodium/calcium exchanger)
MERSWCRCRVESIDGSAVVGEDYVALNEVVVFDPNIVERQVTVEIIDDTEYEPDEQFYLKLSLVAAPGLTSRKSSATGTHLTPNAQWSDDVTLGRVSIMEVTILNDDGTFAFHLME